MRQKGRNLRCMALAAPVGLPSPLILPLPLVAREMAPLLLRRNNHPVPAALLTLGRPRPSPSYAPLCSVGLVSCCLNSSSLSAAPSARPRPRLVFESSGNAAGKLLRGAFLYRLALALSACLLRHLPHFLPRLHRFQSQTRFCSRRRFATVVHHQMAPQS